MAVRKGNVTKSEKLFEMLQYIREYPYLTAGDLALLCNVSERGIYRYINTLTKSGFPVRLRNGGYRLPEDNLDLLGRLDAENLQSVGKLLAIGMIHCGDDELLKQGRELMQLINAALPETGKEVSREIVIIPQGMKGADYGGTVTIGYSRAKLDVINPILTSNAICANLVSLIFSRLVEFDESRRPMPGLAQKWAVSRDGLVWTFFLREDVTFHDGSPLTAQDVEFTYRAILDPKNMVSRPERYNMIDSVEIEGDHIFKVTLKYPFAPFIYKAGLSIAPRHLLENVDLHDTLFNRRPIGSGPFKLMDWMEDDTIVLEANSGYFIQERPILDRLIFKSYPDRETALEAIAENEIDMGLSLTLADIAAASNRKDYQVYPIPTPSYYALIFNLNNPVLKDIRLRKALDYAIDRDSIIENQLKGYGKICTGPFSVDSWSYNQDVQPNSHDIWKARELLDEAGWRDTDKDGMLDRDGEPFEISIAVPTPSDSLERFAVAIRAQLMKVGINAKLIYVDVSELSEVTSEAMLCLVSAGADPDTAHILWHSRSNDNLASYENELVDKLLEQGRQIADIEKRRVLYHRIHEMIHDDYPAIFLASGREFIGSNYSFRDVEFSSMPHFLSTMKDWQIAETEKNR